LLVTPKVKFEDLTPDRHGPSPFQTPKPLRVPHDRADSVIDNRGETLFVSVYRKAHHAGAR
jgi:hypothetical protein